MNMTPNEHIDTDAQTAAFVRCSSAGYAQNYRPHRPQNDR